jgi:hypothetical protein
MVRYGGIIDMEEWGREGRSFGLLVDKLAWMGMCLRCGDID